MAFNSPHWRPKTISRMHRFQKRLANKPTPIEKRVKKYLEDMGEDFLFQEIIDNYIVDFMSPELNLIIECDGHEWHSTPQQKYKDSVRDFDLKRKGYTVLRLLGWQCWNETVCKGLIKDFIEHNRQKGLIEPMGAGVRLSGETVESLTRAQENTLSLGSDSPRHN